MCSTCAAISSRRWAATRRTAASRIPAGLGSLVGAAGAVPAGALLVGDSWVDAETARRGGTRFCFADYGFGTVPRDGLRPGEHRIASFDALQNLLASAG